jgi:DNA end-binding protein Ku
MPRVIWKGALSFSLIHIPVSLHAASRAASLDFDMLDRRDFAPVGYQRINKDSGKPVERDDIVKGYQYEKGEYVVMSDEDFRQANVAATQTIDIQGFVDPGSGETRTLTAPSTSPPERRTAEVVDLSELLKRSLAQRGESRGGAQSGGKRPAAKRAPSTVATSAGTRRRRRA